MDVAFSHWPLQDWRHDKSVQPEESGQKCQWVCGVGQTQGVYERVQEAYQTKISSVKGTPRRTNESANNGRRRQPKKPKEHKVTSKKLEPSEMTKAHRQKRKQNME